MVSADFGALPQLDRGLGYEPRRRGFESLVPRHFMTEKVESEEIIGGVDQIIDQAIIDIDNKTKTLLNDNQWTKNLLIALCGFFIAVVLFVSDKINFFEHGSISISKSLQIFSISMIIPSVAAN